MSLSAQTIARCVVTICNLKLPISEKMRCTTTCISRNFGLELSNAIVLGAVVYTRMHGAVKVAMSYSWNCEADANAFYYKTEQFSCYK